MKAVELRDLTRMVAEISRFLHPHTRTGSVFLGPGQRRRFPDYLVRRRCRSARVDWLPVVLGEKPFATSRCRFSCNVEVSKSTNCLIASSINSAAARGVRTLPFTSRVRTLASRASTNSKVQPLLNCQFLLNRTDSTRVCIKSFQNPLYSGCSQPLTYNGAGVMTGVWPV